MQESVRRYRQAIAAYRQLIETFDADHASVETRELLREARLVLSSLYVIKEDLVQAPRAFTINSVRKWTAAVMV